MKDILLRVMREVLQESSGEALVKGAWPDAGLPENLRVAAIGKAAASMMTGAVQACPHGLQQPLLITKTGHALPWSGRLGEAEVLESTHPLPTRASLDAGARLLDWLTAAEDNASFLFLVSGGASSLVEVLRSPVTLADLQRTNDWLLGSGLPIDEINRVRRRVSRIKGGGLLPFLRGRQAWVWLISDVPGDDPAAVGSGLCYPEPITRRSAAVEYPDWLASMLACLEEESVSGQPIPEHRILGNIDALCQAFAARAVAGGIPATVHDTALEGDAGEQGAAIAKRLQTLSPGFHIWGGETTVRLPSAPGRGGRNQHFALSAAMELAERNNCGLLALGTDGTDGPGEDAGALVDGQTLLRGQDAGLDAGDCLRRADAGSFLEASGDLVVTGPTGTNVQDVVVAWKQ